MTDAVEQTEAAVEATEAPAAAAPLSYEEAAKSVWADDAPTAEPVVDAPAVAPIEAAPVEPAPDPKAERVAARIAVAKRAELRAAQERIEIKSAQEALARQKAELDATAARYKLLEEDPIKAFETLKLDPKTFLEKLSGEYKPENVVDRKVQALEAELNALKAKSAQDEETAKQRAAREEQETAWRQASTGFVQFIEAEAERFPHLVAEYSESEALDAAYKALHEIVGHDGQGRPVTRNEAYFAQFGTYPDDDVVAEHLDAQAKARAEARQQSAWRKRGESAATGSQPVSNGDPNPKAPPVIKGSSPRTLTSRTASEKATASRQMTQEELDAESMRILASGFR